MAELGVAGGRVDETADAIAELRVEVDAALAAAPDVPVRIYHELGDSYFSASSSGFVGAIYAEMGAMFPKPRSQRSGCVGPRR